MGAQLDDREVEWSIACDREIFDKCKNDERFPYIVALARSANALNSVHSLLILAGEELTPQAARDRLNSYFLASALLYEILGLIRRMNKVFQNDEMFQKHLRTLLKDPSAIKIEHAHLKPIRREAVFHFDPESFAETISKGTVNECVFIEAIGGRKGDVNYSFADVVAAEILVGFAEDSKEFYSALEVAMANTRGLAVMFTEASEKVISYHLKQWNFTIRSRAN
jgi:hypothetical protein